MIAAFLITGVAVALIMPHALPRFVAGRIATLFLLGIGANGTVLFLLGTLGVPLRPLTFALIPVVALLVAVMRRRDVLRLARGTRVRGTSQEIASTLVILLPFVVLLWTTRVVPLADYDGVTLWMPKAHAVVLEGSIRGPFFQGERGLNLHNRYPLLMPLNAATLIALGSSARPLFVLIPAAMLLGVRDLLSRRLGRAPASWGFAALAWLPQIVTANEGGASSAYSDLALAAFFGMAIVTRGSPGLWIAFLVLTKNEGLLLALAALLYRPRLRDLVAPAIAFAVLVTWQQSVPDAYDERNAALLRELTRRIAWISDAFMAFARRAGDLRMWGVFWPLVFVCTAIRRKPLCAITPLLAALSGYVLMFSVTSWNIDELARVSADRLLLHCVIPAAWIVIACASASVQPKRTAAVCDTLPHGDPSPA